MPSQYNEDAIIHDFFGFSVGRFLDLGAYDGVTFSNTHKLSMSGWKGVAVEASPQCFKSLQENYRTNNNVTLVCCAVGVNTGFSVFYDSGGAVASLNKEHMEKWKDNQKDFMEINVFTVTPEMLLKSFPGPYDFISIDLEGVSVSVLKLFGDFRKLNTRLLCVEVGATESSEVGSIVGRYGYSLCACTEENSFFKLMV